MVAGTDFDLDYRRIDAAASRDRSGHEAALRRQVVRAMLDLAAGKSDGHHALSYAPGKGDLRDCVTAYIRGDPQRPADFRLVFRELGPTAPGELARRELLAIKPRRGQNNIYAHVCARLNRHPNDRQPGLDRFDGWREFSGGLATRQAELDAKRAIAHAWDGQQPLRSSRPLLVGAPPRASSPGADPSRGRVSVATEASASEPTGHPATTPLPARKSSSPTGWPGRGG